MHNKQDYIKRLEEISERNDGVGHMSGAKGETTFAAS
jgi:hypothetical protein